MREARRMKPETAEQKKWYLLGIVHQLVTEYAKENKYDYETARKIVVGSLIDDLEKKEVK